MNLNPSPDIVAILDQQCARTGQVLDELVYSQRDFVAVQGSDNSIYVASLSSLLIHACCHGHTADLLALATRRLAAIKVNQHTEAAVNDELAQRISEIIQDCGLYRWVSDVAADKIVEHLGLTIYAAEAGWSIEGYLPATPKDHRNQR